MGISRKKRNILKDSLESYNYSLESSDETIIISNKSTKQELYSFGVQKSLSKKEQYILDISTESCIITPVSSDDTMISNIGEISDEINISKNEQDIPKDLVESVSSNKSTSDSLVATVDSTIKKKDLLKPFEEPDLSAERSVGKLIDEDKKKDKDKSTDEEGDLKNVVKPKRLESFVMDKKRWVTWAMARVLPDRQNFTYASFRELYLFLLFILCLVLVLIILSDNTNCSRVFEIFTKTLYKTNASSVDSPSDTYYSIRTIPDLWNQYIQQHFIPVIYLYNHTKPKKMTENSVAIVIFDNILIGPPRIRQVRVQNNSCEIPKIFRSKFKNCYYYFNNKSEDRNPYGPGSDPAWQWQLNKDYLNFDGLISLYSKHGYYFDLNDVLSEVNDTITELKQEKWIDRGTRAVFIDFTVYSPDANLFTVMKLIMELPADGGVIPSATCHSFGLIRFLPAWDFIIFLEILLIAFMAYFIFDMTLNVKYFKWPYLITSCGILDLCIILLIATIIIIIITIEIIIATNLPQMVTNIELNKHTSFDKLVAICNWFYVLLATLIFLSFFKLIKLLCAFTTIAMLFTAIIKSRWYLLILTIGAFILILAFAASGHIFFGARLKEFHSVTISMWSLISIVSSGFNYHEEMLYARPILAPIYLIVLLFTFTVLFPVLFVAVLMHGFKEAELKRMLSGSNARYGPYEYFTLMLIKLCLKLKARPVVNYLRRKYEENLARMRYNLILANLIKYDVYPKEATLFLYTLDKESEHDMDEETLLTVERDLKKHHQNLYKEILEKEKLLNDIRKMQERLTYVETELQYLMY